MTLEGTVINGQIVLDPGAELPEGARVRIELGEIEVGSGHPAEPTLLGLLDLAGIVDDLPSDMARNHDHYVHGTQKR